MNPDLLMIWKSCTESIREPDRRLYWTFYGKRADCGGGKGLVSRAPGIAGNQHTELTAGKNYDHKTNYSQKFWKASGQDHGVFRWNQRTVR